MYIKTDRLELKPIVQESLDDLAELLTDEQVKQTYMVPDFSARAEAEALARRLMDLSGKPERHVAGIYWGDALVGILNETESAADWIEVGYALLPRYHDRGFCTEALRGAIEWFFDRGYRQVLAGAFEENAASIRVMEKSGMTRLNRREEIAYRGRVHACVYYSIGR